MSNRVPRIAFAALALVAGIALVVTLRALEPRKVEHALAPGASLAERETVGVASSDELPTADDEPAPLTEPERAAPPTPTASSHFAPPPQHDLQDLAPAVSERADLPRVGNALDASPPESDQGTECLAYAGRLPADSQTVAGLGLTLAMSAGRLVEGSWSTEVESQSPVRIFELVEGSWSAVHRLESLCADEDHENSSGAVAISGSRVAIARSTCGKEEVHEIELHVRAEAGTWQREASLNSGGSVMPDADIDLFASRIALDGDCLAAVGAMPGEYSGARVSLFSRHGVTWELDATFLPIEAGPMHAASIDLREDRLAIGAVAMDRASEGHAGAVITWRRVDGVWEEEHRWVQSAAHDAGLFGYTLRLVPDGLVVGSPAGDSVGSGTVSFLAGEGEA